MPTFKSLLAELPQGLQKNAIESPDEAQLEQDFGRLAYTFLQDRAAGLIPYLLGFEVVDREPDGSRAIGIFGFKIGENYFYAPVFFIDSQIRGMDLLYAKETNMFMPLRESWINHIVNRQTISLGGPTTSSMDLRRTFEQPNFDYIFKPPLYPGVKRGSVEDLATGLAAAWNQLQAALRESLEKDASFQEAYCGAVAKLEKLELEKTADTALTRWLRDCGGPKAVEGLMAMFQNYDFAKAALSFYPDVESLCVREFDAKLKPAEKAAAKLTVETEACGCSSAMSEPDRKRVVTQGFTIVDKRDDAEKSETYDVDYIKRFSNPDRAGCYDVLLDTGACARAWVFLPQNAGSESGVVVIDVGQQHCFTAEPEAVFVRGDAIDDGAKYWDKAVALSKIEVGGTYVLVNDRGNATPPLSIRSIIAEDGKRMKMSFYTSGNHYSRPTYGKDFNSPIHSDRSSHSDFRNKDWLCISGKHRDLAVSGDTVTVPETWRALEIDKDRKLDYEQRRLFKPGGLGAVYTALEKNAVHRITIGSDDGLEYYIKFDDMMDADRLGYKSACVRLVQRYGTSVEDAEAMLKQAQHSFKCRRFIKFAQLPGINMPYGPAPVTSTDDMSGAVVTYPQVDMVRGQTVGVTPPQYSLTPGFNIGGEAQTDLNAANSAIGAAQAGQKSVFDHAVIGGLAKTYDVGSVIDTYVPDLLQALDKLGRILFLFYWQNQEFVTRYGNEDMAELEDTIRGVFKNFGDLVLKLRQKSIESDNADSVLLS